MESLATREIFLFEGFRLDWRGLFRRDERGMFIPVAIGARALDVLRVLIAARGELVSKDEIRAAVWPGIVVEDNNLTVQMSSLRRILDQESAEGSCIQTVAGRGYRFVPTATRAPPATSVSQPIVAPRLSIVVLPFANLSNDPEQGYFADGITEDLTTDLSRIAGMFVISRNTAFTYKNKPIDTRQIGRELGVRYVLEGSVRRSGSRVRINAQLIDAETDAHLWAERCDCATADLFALQDEITRWIAIAINPMLVTAEASRPTQNPDALDYLFRARVAGWKPPSRDKYAEQISLLERALALDPLSIEARSSLAIALTSRAISGMADTAAADIARADGLAQQLWAASPRNPLVHFAKGQVLRAQGRFEEAIPEYETAIASNRNWVGALHPLGQCKLFAGSIEETIPLEEQAIRLSPRDPELLGVWYSQIGLVHLLQSRTDEAICWLESRAAPRRNAPTFTRTSPPPMP